VGLVLLGVTVGILVMGVALGEAVGVKKGYAVGVTEGENDGSTEGRFEGIRLEEKMDGVELGESVIGRKVLGLAEGVAEESAIVGLAEGIAESAIVGLAEGVAEEGAIVGLMAMGEVGSFDGAIVATQALKEADCGGE
jgi:hypothetical protein